MSKTGETNWIESGKKPRTFSEMREAFSQIRNRMSDWRQKQISGVSEPGEDIESRLQHLNGLVQQLKDDDEHMLRMFNDAAAAYWNTISNTKPLPAGAIIYVCMHNPPSGFLKADGSEVYRQDYPDLFSAIGVRFGSGDGVSTFKLPDLRGEFIRSLDNGRGVDAGRELGNVQMDEFKSHYHGFLDRPNMRLESGVYTWTPQVMEVAEQDSISTTRAGGSETRPRNIALLACIKI